MRAGRIGGFGRSAGSGRSNRWIENLPRRMRTLAYKSIDVPVGPLDLKETRRTMESVRNDCGLFGGKPTTKKMVGFVVDVITLSIVAAAFAYVLLNPPIYELGEVCPLCDGKGREPCPVCRSNPGYDPRYHPLEGKNKPCPICRGTMSVVCMCCKGAGGARKQSEGDV